MDSSAAGSKIEELRARLKADPKSRLFYPLAEELRKAGRLAEAEEFLLNGLAANPAYLSAWVSLGRVLRDSSKFSGAVDAFNKALSLDAENVVAARLLGETYLDLGQKVEAIKKFKLVHALLPLDQEMEGIIDALDRELNPQRYEPAPVVAAPVQPEVRETAPLEDDSPLANAVMPPAAPFMLEEPVADTPAATMENPFAAESGEEAFPSTMELAAPFVKTGGEESAEVMAGGDALLEPIEDSLPVAPVFDGGGFIEAVDVDSLSTGSAPMQVLQEPHDTMPPFFSESPSDVEASRVSEEQPLPAIAESSAALEPAAEMPASREVAPPESSGTQDVFSHDAAERAAVPVQVEGGHPEDLTSTITIAELYERQGHLAAARQIYERFLQRHPERDDIRVRLESMPAAAPASRAEIVRRLESWMAKVAQRENSRV